MIIKRLDKKNKRFHELKPGAVFTAPNDMPYMKCDPVSISVAAYYNAVNLKLGLITAFHDSDPVVEEEATLELKVKV